MEGTDVYVAGLHDNGSKDVAVYWKNDTPVYLTDGSQHASASSIIISSGEVYVAGMQNNGSKDVATYWKNGVAVALTDGNQNAYAQFIAVVRTLGEK